MTLRIRDLLELMGLSGTDGQMGPISSFVGSPKAQFAVKKDLTGKQLLWQTGFDRKTAPLDPPKTRFAVKRDLTGKSGKQFI